MTIRNTIDYPGGVIVCNVPETSAFYKLNADAFFTSTKAVQRKLIKAVQADVFNAAENAHKLQEWAADHYCSKTAAPVLKVCADILNGDACRELTREQKAINKKIMAFCPSGQVAERRPLLARPFLSDDGILYASDSFIACRVNNRDAYTGEFNEHVSDAGTAPSMGRLFEDLETVKREYTPFTLPALDVLKVWSNGGKLNRRTIDTAAKLKAGPAYFLAAYVYRCQALTGAEVVYINTNEPMKPAYVLSEDFTCIMLPIRMQDAAKHYAGLPEVCLFMHDESGAVLQVQECTGSEYIPALKRNRKPAKAAARKPETATPAPIQDAGTMQQGEAVNQEETNEAGAPAGKEHANDAAGAAVVPTDETVNPAAVVADPHGINMQHFTSVYIRAYAFLYDNGIYMRDLVARFDYGLTAYETGVLKAFIQRRGDGVTSDREAMAFCMALDEIQAEKNTSATDAGQAENDTISAKPDTETAAAGQEVTASISGKQDAQTVPAGIGPKTAENGPKTSRTVNASPESIPRRISNGRPIVAHNSIMPFTQGRDAGKTADGAIYPTYCNGVTIAKYPSPTDTGWTAYSIGFSGYKSGTPPGGVLSAPFCDFCTVLQPSAMSYEPFLR